MSEENCKDGRNSANRKRHKVVVVMPAFNAEKTLLATYHELPADWYDDIVLVDDASTDNTVNLASQLPLHLIKHPQNRGYGANQKTCYAKALELGAEIVVMIHPDNQYSPQILPTLVIPISEKQADVVLASRFIRNPLKGGPIQGGMPVYKYVFNRLLTIFQNWVLGTYFSEFHTGYRAFSRKAIESVNWRANSDGFVFDNEMILQLVHKQLSFHEVAVETRYFREASSINFISSIKYGMGVMWTTFKYWLHKKGWKQFEFLK